MGQLICGWKAEGPSYPPIPELKTKTESIVKLMTGLNPSKAAGPDEIPAPILKTLAIELAPVVTSIFSQSLDTREVPKGWSMAWITPVFKVTQRTTGWFHSNAPCAK